MRQTQDYETIVFSVFISPCSCLKHLTYLQENWYTLYTIMDHKNSLTFFPTIRTREFDTR